MNITPLALTRVFVQLFAKLKQHPLLLAQSEFSSSSQYIYIYYNHLARYTGRMPASLRSCSNTMNVTTVCGPMRSQLGTKPL